MTTVLDSLRHLSCLLAAAAILLGPARRTSADYLEEVFADNPIGYWRFEETDGPALDWTGNGYDGVYMNGVTPGLFPGALSIGGKSAAFDGTTGFVDLPGSWGGEAMTELTLEAWVKPETGGSLIKRMVKKYRPKAIIGVGCHMEVKEGTAKMASYGLPVQGVILDRDGCVDTRVDAVKLLEKIKAHSRHGRYHIEDDEEFLGKAIGASNMWRDSIPSDVEVVSLAPTTR